jgi:hypothetical protein
MVAPCWGDVVSDLDVLAEILEQAGFEMSPCRAAGFSIEREGYTIHFQFEAGRLTDIRVTVTHAA